MLPRPVLCITITGLFPPRQIPAHIPIPFSSLVRGIEKILLLIRGSSAFILSHGSVAAKSILFSLSILTTFCSGLSIRPLPFRQLSLQEAHWHFLHVRPVRFCTCDNPSQASLLHRL